MGLLQELPNAEQLTSILAPLIGDEVAGTGVAGVLQLLEQIDTTNLSASLAVNLDQQFSLDVSGDTSALTGGALSQLQQAVNAFPPDPAALIQPLSAKLESLTDLSATNLSTQLLTGIDGLKNLESLIPPNARELVAGAADRLVQLKGELISGAFGQLRQWSESVQKLYAEIQPLLSAGPGTLEERLMAYLRDKITELVRLILPSESLALAITGRLDAAMSTDRLATIDTIKADLINAMNLARSEFAQGNFTNTVHFAAVQARFQQLTDTLAEITARLRQLLSQPIATAAGLSHALQQQFDHFAQIEIIDLGNIKEKFVAAIEDVQKAIEGLDLGAVRHQIEAVFEQINGVIGKFDLHQLTAKLDDMQGQLRAIVDTLDAALFEAVAAIRAVFTQIKDAVQSVATALGSYDAQGNFHFNVQQDIENFLNGVKTTLQETIRPLLEHFKNTVGQTLQGVQDGLKTVQGEIEAVKAQLQNTLQGINGQLQSLDVAGTVEATRQKLDSMLSALGTINFDPIIDPVITQINEMRDGLKKIDVSSLNEFTIGALKVSVEVVVQLDFSVQITTALMAEFDQLLELPKQALGGIEASVEGALQRFGQLAPEALLEPLDVLFDPITTHLDAINLESILQPLDAWYARAQQELDKVSPAALLQPLIGLHVKLAGALEAISPAALMRPLREAMEGIKAQMQRLDVTGLAAELSGVLHQAQEALDKIAPERLLAPLVSAFDKIMEALDSFDPGVLLQPFADIFAALTTPLANLTADHARVITEAFAVLHGMLDAFDPRALFETVRQKLTALHTLVQQLNVGGLIAALKGPYDAMHAAFAAHGGPAHVSLAVSVEGLNPLRNALITQAAADWQRIQAQLNALAQAEPPAELVSRYNNEIKSQLTSLIPSWARGNISPDSVRRAFQLANPVNLTAEITQLYDTAKQQVHNFDPRIVQEQVKASFEQVKAAIVGLDPEAIVGKVQVMVNALTHKLDAFDLQLIAQELQGLTDEVQALLSGLDPRPISAQLQGLVDEVTRVVAELRPAAVLGELTAPFQRSKEIVAEFNPSVFKEPLQAVFEDIQKVLAAIDIGVVLQPLTERLEQLRSALEQSLQRTETAFNGMLAAIPV